MRPNLGAGKLLALSLLATPLVGALPQAASAADVSCPPTPTFTVTHIKVTTVQNGPEFDGTGEVTVESNAVGYDLTATGPDGFVYDEFGSPNTTHQATVYDFGPGRIGPGDTRDYKLELHPYDSNPCYDSDTGAGDGTQVATKTLTVTFYAVGEGGEATVDGTTVPGSDPETPIPGAPTPTISGDVRVGETDTCAATAPAHGSVGGYQWSVAGTPVGTGKTYEIQVADYGKSLTCEARLYNNARKPGPVGTSSASNIAIGKPLTPTSKPAFDGETRSGGHLRVTHGVWSPKPSSYKYQWYVGTKKLKGATSSSIKVPKSAIGKWVYARVTAIAPGYAHGTIKVRVFQKIPF